MPADDKKMIEAAFQKITEAMADEKKLVQVGFTSFALMTFGPDITKPEYAKTYDNLRNTFFAGAQHLFASIVNILDAGEEITEKDMQRMSNISSELETFVKDFELKHMPTQGVA